MTSTITKTVLGALAALSLMLGTGLAFAQQTSLCARTTNPVANSCNAEFQLLYADLIEAWSNDAFKSKNAAKDCDGLITKVDNAVAKVNSTPPKYGDAEQKLSQVIAKVGDLAAQGKLVEVGTDIAGEAYNVQKCLPGGIQ